MAISRRRFWSFWLVTDVGDKTKNGDLRTRQNFNRPMATEYNDSVFVFVTAISQSTMTQMIICFFSNKLSVTNGISQDDNTRHIRFFVVRNNALFVRVRIRKQVHRQVRHHLLSHNPSLTPFLWFPSHPPHTF